MPQDYSILLPVPCLWATLCPSATRVTWENTAQTRDSNRIAEISHTKLDETTILMPCVPNSCWPNKAKAWFVCESTFPKWFPESPYKNGTASCSKGTRLFRLPMVHSRSELSWIGAWGLGWHIVAQFLLRLKSCSCQVDRIPSNLSWNVVIWDMFWCVNIRVYIYLCLISRLQSNLV